MLTAQVADKEAQLSAVLAETVQLQGQLDGLKVGAASACC